jgi:pimeloyl-ACP methyl ester carboxylesterase
VSRVESFTHDDLEFDVLDEGPLDGEVVLLLHGFPERATCWRRVAPLLHEAGYRTIAPDQRGYSRGARPRRRRDYRVRHLVSDVAALVEQVDGPVHVVGHDWGAVVAWALAIRRPDLVRSLVAVSVPHPTAYTRALLTSRQLRRSWYIVLFNLPFLTERLAARPGGRFDATMKRTGMTDDDVARFRREMVDDGALHYALGWYRALPLGDLAAGSDLRVAVPTTMVWSNRDGAIDRAGVNATVRYVDADYELVVLDGADHWIPVHEPEALAEAALKRFASA